MTELHLADFVASIESLYPTDTAQSWDQVGLVSGDLDQPIRRVLLAVDPTVAVIEDARASGVDLLITHHPLLMRGVHSVATTSAKGAAVTSLIVGDVALYVAHTNADVADPGVNTALAAAAGLSSTEPLTYEEGHPLGLVGDLAAETTLRDFAARLAAALPAAPAGLRVAGDPDAKIRRIAVHGGAGDGAFDAVRASKADVYVTADLRHHPALEAREESRGGPPYLIDAGHWATEWLWLESARTQILSALGARADSVEIQVSIRCTDPWDFTVATDSHATTPHTPEAPAES
ncbi:Nif3-like dinuclear metal center hexameric protein [Demetria terragena]|uniref:Nif3-like dinuclear metal center hexameric protein n=1 Tax=Demetria terragena TaxID=63959 RepID=UPI00036BAE4F|nr:Nif3-like dinuclear metal center hexameric protein [Demetria terragena]